MLLLNNQWFQRQIRSRVLPGELSGHRLTLGKDYAGLQLHPVSSDQGSPYAREQASNLTGSNTVGHGSKARIRGRLLLHPAAGAEGDNSPAALSASFTSLQSSRL